jgi:Flp pilus assembly protein TadB
LVATVAAVGTLAVVGGVTGVVAAAVVGGAAWIGLMRLEPPGLVRDRERAVAAVPLAADLLAAALGAGCPPVVAVAAVADAIGGPLGKALATAAATARIGAEPARAWAGMAADPGLRPLARALTAATGRGTSPVQVLERVAEDARDTARRAAEARARSLGARAAAPLGLCFLPAFVLVGVVPIVVTAGGFLL